MYITITLKLDSILYNYNKLFLSFCQIEKT